MSIGVCWLWVCNCFSRVKLLVCGSIMFRISRLKVLFRWCVVWLLWFFYLIVCLMWVRWEMMVLVMLVVFLISRMCMGFLVLFFDVVAVGCCLGRLLLYV